jgi:ABC-type glutathione transport system ATPase component
MLAFADIGEFIDQPVKTYSSGMYVRLAFSVAIHVSPDILVVDEALAVGDAFFQARCMARMKRMLDDGITMLFISHDIAAVKALCNDVLWLERGRVRRLGPDRFGRQPVHPGLGGPGQPAGGGNVRRRRPASTHRPASGRAVGGIGWRRIG